MMEKKTRYTAVGHFRRKSDTDGRSYPVVTVNSKEYPLDMQEMAVWSILNWRLMDFGQIEENYEQLAKELPPARRTLEVCLNRLEVRGLTASGTGDTDFDALYNLLGELYVVPLSESLPLRLATFLKLTLKGTPFSQAKRLFGKDHPNDWEAQVMALARQAMLSTAELVKCAEVGATDVSTGEKIMDTLYNDGFTTSDNIMYEMLNAECKEDVTLAVANLYLRKQIIFQRV